jgi:substrate import-associated zinc metallohydrolase lipoprotein
MKILRNIFLTTMVVTVFSCTKKENLSYTPSPGLGGDSSAPTAIDLWIHDSLTVPFNIAVKYKWDPFELSQLDADLVPPDESKIIPTLSFLKRVWIEPYKQETGSDLFVQTYAPKQLVMVGSVQFNPNNTVLLGQAEGGNTIQFFDINQAEDKDPVSSIMRMIQTAHHEFAHILHQNIIYPVEFKTIYQQFGLNGYSSTWFNTSSREALANGYITPYASAKDNEDFVEMIANMLVLGRTRFDELVNAQNVNAQAALRAKEEIVVQYLLKNYNIDFYQLQTYVQQALKSIAATPALGDIFGFDKKYSTVTVNGSNTSLIPLPQPFLNIYNEVADSITLYGSPALTMDSIAIENVSADSTDLKIFFSQQGNPFIASYRFGITEVSTNLFDFSYGSTVDDNAELLFNAVAPLLDYLDLHNFTVSWYKDPEQSIFPRVKYTPVDETGTFFIGLVAP